MGASGWFGRMDGERRTALDVWRGINARALSARGPDLTARQTAILLTVHLDAGPHTVRGLAEALSLGKPAVVRAVDTLEAAGLLARTPDPADRRSVFIIATETGATRLAAMAGDIARALADLQADPATAAPTPLTGPDGEGDQAVA